VKDIVSIAASPFSLPATLFEVVQAAATVGGNGVAFVGHFSNGVSANFAATAYSQEVFFQMPEGLSGDDLKSVLPREAVTGPTYCAKPHFSCFV